MTMNGSKLDGQTVLITGAARRLGAEMARSFHAEGAGVVVHYGRSREAADALVAGLNAQRPDSAMAIGADLLDPASPARIVAAALERFGALHALVNNASTFYPTRLGEIREEDWIDLMGSNLKAPLFLSQAAAPALAKTGGAIVNLVDIHADRPLAGHTVYCCAKAANAMLTRSLALELGPQVRVNGIAPGPILWPENDMGDAAKDAIVATTALKRTGTAQDIARTALFLIADAPYVTGQIVAVDGGRSLALA